MLDLFFLGVVNVLDDLSFVQELVHVVLARTFTIVVCAQSWVPTISVPLPSVICSSEFGSDRRIRWWAVVRVVLTIPIDVRIRL